MLFEVRIKLERGKRFFVVGVVTAARRLCRETKAMSIGDPLMRLCKEQTVKEKVIGEARETKSTTNQAE